MLHKLRSSLVLFSLSLVHSNLLCDDSRIATLKGSWLYDSNECSWENTDFAAGNVIWFGDYTGTEPDPEFESYSSFSRKI